MAGRQITIKEVYEWFIKVEKESSKTVCDRFIEVFGSYDCNPKSLYWKIKSMKNKIITLRRNKKEALENYFQSYFIMPKKESILDRSINATETVKEKHLILELTDSKKENRTLKRKLEKQESVIDRLDSVEEQYIEALDGMKLLELETKKVIRDKENDVETVSKKFNSIQKKYEQTSQELLNVELKLQKTGVSAAKIRRLNRKIMYRNEKIESQKDEIKLMKKKIESEEKEKLELSKKMTSMSSKLDILNDNTINQLKEEKHSAQKKILYLQKKINNDVDVSDMNLYQKEINDLETKVSALTKENGDLQKLVSLLEDDEIVTFENGRYTNELRDVIMELLSLNVSMTQVNNVIKTVLKKLGKKDVIRLPSAGVRSRLLQEALILAQSQVAKSMLEDGSAVNCLHGDGTSKYHHHYQNFQVTTASGKTLSFGLAEISGGDAASTLQCFTEAIDDLCDAICSKDKETDFAKLVTSIKTTMSDLGPVNPVFNAQLKQLRESLLPRAIDQWNELNLKQQSDLSEMANFYCKLHLLANFATETDKVLKSFENMLLNDDYETVFAFNNKESGAARLVRTACKAFQVRGSDEAGVASYFNSFISGRGEKSLLVPFIGNRFNILYYNAAALYYHSDAIKDFFKHWPDPNNLIKAVNEDITNDLFLAEVRALGIVDKLVTGPLWRLIESTKNILSLNPYLFRLKVKLSSLCNDASSLLNGNTIFSEDDVEHHRDILWQKLFEETSEEFDVMTQQALEVVIHSILIILERQCVDQLPGGKYWHPSDLIASSSKNVPTTNKASESDFAILDLLIRGKPSASIQSIQALTMWARNGTAQWLNSLSADEHDQLLNNARVNVMKMKEKYKKRKLELIDGNRIRLLRKQELKNEAEAKENAKKIDAVNHLQDLGVRVWLSVEEAEKNFDKVGENDKVNVVLCQIEFYRYVMKVKCPQKIFTKTKIVDNKRIGKPVDELFDNLKVLIQANLLPENHQIIKPSLKCPQDREVAVQSSKKDLMNKIKDARINRICKQQKSEMLSKFLDNPELLVQKSFQHRVVEEDDSEVYWSRGVVISVARTFSNTRRTEFNVRYDEEPNIIWKFPLLSDMEKGDLLVL